MRHNLAPYVGGHYFMTSLGYFGLLSTLVTALSAKAFSAAQIAVLVTLFTLVNKVAKIPLAPWIDRMAPEQAVLSGCWLAGFGLAFLGRAGNVTPVALILCAAAVGISINNLASKQLAAAASDVAPSRAKLFSMVSMMINVAAAVSAPVALQLIDRGYGLYVPYLVATAYFVAGTVTYLNFSRLGVKQTHAGTVALNVYLEMSRLPGLKGFLAVNFFGWFLYGQLFNMLALHVTVGLGSPGRLGWLYTLNALLIVFLQLTTTSVAERLCGGRQYRVVRGSFILFAVAFASACTIPGYAGSVVFVVLFTAAEMLFVPSVDVLLLDIIGKRNRAIGYSILAISTALGESLGGGGGVALYRWTAALGSTAESWMLLSLLSLLFIVFTHRIERASLAVAQPA
jgi:MFS transporter, DHA1 family, multidrug resistance protein